MSLDDLPASSQLHRIQNLNRFRILDKERSLNKYTETIDVFDGPQDDPVIAGQGFCNGDAFIWSLSHMLGKGAEFESFSEKMGKYTQDELKNVIKQHRAYLAHLAIQEMRISPVGLTFQQKQTLLNIDPDMDLNTSPLLLPDDSPKKKSYIETIEASHKEYLDILNYYNDILLYFEPDEVLPELTQADFTTVINYIEGLLDTFQSTQAHEPSNLKDLPPIDKPHYTQEFAIAGAYTEQQIEKILEEIFKSAEGKVVHLSSFEHATAAFKDGDQYKFWDPTYGLKTADSIQELTRIFIEGVNFDTRNDFIPCIKIQVVGHTSKPKQVYIDKNELFQQLDHIAETTGHSTLIDIKGHNSYDSLSNAAVAAGSGDFELLRYIEQKGWSFIKHGQYDKDVIQMAAKYGQPEMLAYFLDQAPEQCKESIYKDIITWSCFSGQTSVLNEFKTELQPYLNERIYFPESRTTETPLELNLRGWPKANIIEALVEMGAEIYSETKEINPILSSMNISRHDIATSLFDKALSKNEINLEQMLQLINKSNSFDRIDDYLAVYVKHYTCNPANIQALSDLFKSHEHNGKLLMKVSRIPNEDLNALLTSNEIDLSKLLYDGSSIRALYDSEISVDDLKSKLSSPAPQPVMVRSGFIPGYQDRHQSESSHSKPVEHDTAKPTLDREESTSNKMKRR